MSPAMPDTGLTEDYLSSMSEEESRFTDKMVNGHAKTFEQYREYVGYVKGLRRAEHLLHETIKRYTEMQDEF